MTSFSALTARQKAIEPLRWLALLPAAALAATIVEYVAYRSLRLAAYGWGKDSDFVYWWRLAVGYAPKEAIFVLLGGAIAPRFKLSTSIVLAAACILWSLAKHILVQPHPGHTNYTHFALDTLGAIFGAVYIAYRARRTRPDEAVTQD